MAGVGEASAIVGLIGTAATLSKAVVDIASKYKNARKQIESFGREVGILGNVLDQLHRLQEKDHMEADDGVHSVTMTILDQCTELFSELNTYKDALYSRPGSVRSLTFRGKAQWVFTATELDYIRARLESVKTNMLLMMTMQCRHNSDRSRNDRTIHELSVQSDGWAKRLETLEKEMMLPNDSSNDPAVNRMSIRVVDTAESARSTRDSILSLYGHRSYYQKILDPREGPFAMALELQADYSRVSRIIDDHLEDDLMPVEAASNAVDKGLDVHAYASAKPADSSEKSESLAEVLRYPCRAIALNSHGPYRNFPHALSFEEDEVLQVATFSESTWTSHGRTWRVRNKTGKEALAPCYCLKPYYPYRAEVRSDLIYTQTTARFATLRANEILYVSDQVFLDPPTNGYHVCRPWRKPTGETGIAPDSFFNLYSMEKPLPPLPELMRCQFGGRFKETGATG